MCRFCSVPSDILLIEEVEPVRIRNACLLIVFLAAACFEQGHRNGKYELENVGGALDLKVMTFNILSNSDIGTLAAGYPRWTERREQVFATIKDHSPDLVAIEECTPNQLDEFEFYFGGDYEIIENRSVTPDTIIMYRHDRFDLIERGHWVLESATQLRIPRMAMWVKLSEKSAQRDLMFVGVHMDANKFKVKEAHFLCDRTRAQMASGAPLILAGDFNMTPDHAGYKVLAGCGWIDAYTGPTGEEISTFTTKIPRRRIDHIFYSSADVHPTRWQALVGGKGIDMSDHRAVLAEFHIDAAPL